MLRGGRLRLNRENEHFLYLGGLNAGATPGPTRSGSFDIPAKADTGCAPSSTMKPAKDSTPDPTTREALPETPVLIAPSPQDPVKARRGGKLWNKGAVYRLRQREWRKFDLRRHADNAFANRAWWFSAIVVIVAFAALARWISRGDRAHATGTIPSANRVRQAP